MKNNKKIMRILGIDPGTNVTGYGIIDFDKPNKFKTVDFGTIKLNPKEDFNAKLTTIHCELTKIIEKFSPEIFVIEESFFGVNPRTIIKLGHARGVSILAATLKSIPVFEYSPREIKLALVGKGAAAKQQVQFMVRILLKLTQNPTEDEADALAAAICHANKIKS
ncbi:crossover junction endodeoxyribonuclease RuvC [bacterium]|nr:crossover junction endodeoxyribonuclease RuvC [bacterium]